MPKKIKDNMALIIAAAAIISVILTVQSKMFYDMNRRLDNIEAQTKMIKPEEDLKRLAYTQAVDCYMAMNILRNKN